MQQIDFNPEGQPLKDFISSFTFDQSNYGAVGITQEFFLQSGVGKPRQLLPQAKGFLQHVREPSHWSPTLSACKVKSKLPPIHEMSQLVVALRKNWHEGESAAAKVGCKLFACDAISGYMPEDVYPDEPRYLMLKKNMTEGEFNASIRVAKTHIHLGLSSLDEAIQASNIFLQYFPEIVRKTDTSYGERMRLLAQSALHIFPPKYDGVAHYFKVAREQGFDQNPRNCRHLIRITRHGAIEFRVFGIGIGTREVYEPEMVVRWASYLKEFLNL